MGDQISWRVELAVKPGELENFQALTGEMVEATRDEPGTLSYERFVTDDGKIRPRLRAIRRFGRGAGALAEVWEDLRRAVREHGGPHTVHRVWQPE
jgi:quinol monooxygenase YgiN